MDSPTNPPKGVVSNRVNEINSRRTTSSENVLAMINPQTIVAPRPKSNSRPISTSRLGSSSTLGISSPRESKVEIFDLKPLKEEVEAILKDKNVNYIVLGYFDGFGDLCIIKKGEGEDKLPLLASDYVSYGVVRFLPSLSENVKIASFSYLGKDEINSRSVLQLKTRYSDNHHKITNMLLSITDFEYKTSGNEIEFESLEKQYLNSKKGKHDDIISFKIAALDATDAIIQENYSRMHNFDLNDLQWMLMKYSSEIGNENKLELVASGLSTISDTLAQTNNNIIKSIRANEYFFLYLRVNLNLKKEIFILATINIKDKTSETEVNGSGSNMRGSSFSEMLPEEGANEIRKNSTPKRRSSTVSNTAKLTQHKNALHKAFFHHHVMNIESTSCLSPLWLMEKIKQMAFAAGIVLRAVLVDEADIHPAKRLRIPEDGTLGHLKDSIVEVFGIPKNLQLLSVLKENNAFNNKTSELKIIEAVDKTQCSVLGLRHGDKLHVERLVNENEKKSIHVANMISKGVLGSLGETRRSEGLTAIAMKEQEFSQRISNLKDSLKDTIAKMDRKLKKSRVESSMETSDIEDLEVNAVGSPISKLDFNRAVTESELLMSSPLPSNSPLLPSPKVTLDFDASSAPENESTIRELQRSISQVEVEAECMEIPMIELEAFNEKTLGCGKNAVVSRMLWKTSTTTIEVAVKSFKYSKLTDHILNEFRKETATLRKLRHKNILILIGVVTSPRLMIVTEFMTRGSLYGVLQSAIYKDVSFLGKVRMALDMALGMEYLHSKNIAHRDIKSHNMLIDEDWKVKVADFGACKVDVENETCKTEIGTSGWVAPEILKGDYDEKTGYNGLLGERPEIPADVPASFKKVINECWKSKAEERISFVNVVIALMAIKEEEEGRLGVKSEE